MPYIHFRIHRLDIWEQVSTFLVQNGTHILSVKEIESERPHIHTVFQFDKTKSTFGQRLKKKFPILSGNKDFSISEVGDTPQDLQNLLQYVCKGEQTQSEDKPHGLPDIVLHHPKDYYDVMKLHNDYWIKNAELKASNVKVQSDKTFKEKKLSFTEDVIVCLRKQNSQMNWDMTPTHMRIVFNMVISKLGEKSKVFDRSVLRRLVFGALNVLTPDKSSEYHWEKSFDNQDF